MKKINFIPIYIFLILITGTVSSQNIQDITLQAADEPIQNAGLCVLPHEMADIRSRVEKAKMELSEKGLINANKTVAFGAHAFRWPLAPAKHVHRQGVYYISNYVDLDGVSTGNSGSNSAHTLEDYNCGTRTYDVASGYDHTGIDIGIGPFGWTAMDNGDVDIVAAEGGYIADKLDGQFDRNCITGTPNVYHGNYVALTHSDGSTTYYMHMKSGTVTSKLIGHYVSAGEYLGKVGSSGNSTGPHLHFQVEDNNGLVRDPFQNGSCANGLNASLWAAEEPYINKQIISAFTLSSTWTNPTCDTANFLATTGNVPYANHFSSGSLIWFSASVRDITSGNTINLKIISPAGSTLMNVNYTEQNSFVALRTLSPNFIQAPNTSGTYKLQITYNGVIRAHYFTVGCPGSTSIAGTRSSNYGYISGGSINSTDVISSSARNVQYQAETFIQLNDGFTATNGCEFTAYIDNCTTGSTKLESITSSTFDFNVMPNPASDEINIVPLLDADDATCLVQIHNAVGAVVLSTTTENFTNGFKLNTSELTNGIYIINVLVKSTEGEIKSTKKLVINH